MQTTNDPVPTAGPGFAVAGRFLEALAARDFDRLTGTLTGDAALAALLPRGFDEWQGSAEIRGAFVRWFGDAERVRGRGRIGGPGR